MKFEHTIEALRLCSQNYDNCKDCPYESIERCTEHLHFNALIEIKHISAKIKESNPDFFKNLPQETAQLYNRVNRGLDACQTLRHCGRCDYSNGCSNYSSHDGERALRTDALVMLTKLHSTYDELCDEKEVLNVIEFKHQYTKMRRYENV